MASKQRQHQHYRSQRYIMINKTLIPYCYKDNINAAVISDISQLIRRWHRTTIKNKDNINAIAISNAL